MMMKINTIKKIGFVILVFMFIKLVSCDVKDDNPTTRALYHAAKYYNITDLKGWENQLPYSGVDSISFPSVDNLYFGGYYVFNKIDGDTVYLLTFEYYESNDDTAFFPYDYYKRFEEELTYYNFISFDKLSDTLYYYKADIYGAMKKIFYRGKYYYQYKFNELKAEERKFFEANKDSLTKIRGHNLPKLIPLMN